MFGWSPLKSAGLQLNFYQPVEFNKTGIHFDTKRPTFLSPGQVRRFLKGRAMEECRAYPACVYTRGKNDLDVKWSKTGKLRQGHRIAVAHQRPGRRVESTARIDEVHRQC